MKSNHDFVIRDDTADPLLELCSDGTIWSKGREVTNDPDLVKALWAVIEHENPNSVLVDSLEVAKERIRFLQRRLETEEDERKAYNACFAAERHLRKQTMALFGRLKKVFADLDPPEAAITARRLLDEGGKRLVLQELEIAVQEAMKSFLKSGNSGIVLGKMINEALKKCVYAPRIEVIVKLVEP